MLVDREEHLLKEVVDAEDGDPKAKPEDPSDVGEEVQQGHSRLLLKFPHLQKNSNQPGMACN